MDWAEDYLSQCLSGIPKSKYRARLRSELEEHLAQLEDDLQAAGRGPEEAQSEALRQMGDAETLNEDYRAEWFQQPERRRWDLTRELYGCLLAGFLSFLASTVLGVLWNIFDGPLRSAPIWISGVALYLSAAIPDVLFLRAAFRERTDRRKRMICGLLLMWCVGSGVMLLGIGTLYGQVFPLPAYSGRLTGTADGFWVRGTVRWFTYPFLLWTLAASPLLGCFFPLKRRQAHENRGR